MTRKHFEAIALIIKNARIPNAAAGFDDGFDAGVEDVATSLADYFAGENPRFDREKFLTACGI